MLYVLLDNRRVQAHIQTPERNGLTRPRNRQVVRRARSQGVGSVQTRSIRNFTIYLQQDGRTALVLDR